MQISVNSSEYTDDKTKVRPTTGKHVESNAENNLRTIGVHRSMLAFYFSDVTWLLAPCKYVGIKPAQNEGDEVL